MRGQVDEKMNQKHIAPTACRVCPLHAVVVSRGTRVGGSDMPEGEMMRFVSEEAGTDSRKSETMNQCYHNEASKRYVVKVVFAREEEGREEHNYDRKISVLIDA